MSTPNPDRAKVLWNKGMNFFSSFFAEIDNVRQEINDDQVFMKWCLNELQIGPSVMNTVKDILPKADAALVREQLKPLKDAEAARKYWEKDAREKEKLAAEAARLEEKKRIASEQARIRVEEQAERERLAAEKKLAARALRKKETNHRYLGNVKDLVTIPKQNWSEEECLKRFKKSYAKMHEYFIESCEALYELRCKYKSDKIFHDCLVRNNINLNHTDRAAMLQIAEHLDETRDVLLTLKSTSAQLIWKEVRKQLPAPV